MAIYFVKIKKVIAVLRVCFRSKINLLFPADILYVLFLLFPSLRKIELNQVTPLWPMGFYYIYFA